MAGILDLLQEAAEELAQDNYQKAKSLAHEIDLRLNDARGSTIYPSALNVLSSILIDAGSSTHDEPCLDRGIALASEAVQLSQTDGGSPELLYNLANGLSTKWYWNSDIALSKGKIGDSYTDALHYFRSAKEASGFGSQSRKFMCELFTNAGNCLDYSWRHFEALDHYNAALMLNPNFSPALGNKALTLLYLWPFMHGREHLCLSEIRWLFERALGSECDPEMRRIFEDHLETVTLIISEHPHFEVETIETIAPKSPYGEFLRDLCLDYELFLNPVNCFESTNAVDASDSFYIYEMYQPLSSDRRVERNFTFLNEIKCDYVLARHLFAQSQFQSLEIDDVDRGLVLYSSLEYDSWSTYAQLMKSAFRMSMDILDKIACFINEYSGAGIGENNVYFKTFFEEPRAKGDGQQTGALRTRTLRKSLHKHCCGPLMALFSLSLDLQKDGYLDDMMSLRNHITHKVLVLHSELYSGEGDKTIAHRFAHGFSLDVLHALQYARSAILQLILFVQTIEGTNAPIGPVAILSALEIDERLRWKPTLRSRPHRSE